MDPDPVRAAVLCALAGVRAGDRVAAVGAGAAYEVATAVAAAWSAAGPPPAP